VVREGFRLGWQYFVTFNPEWPVLIFGIGLFC
jgi:hypothetical protein